MWRAHHTVKSSCLISACLSLPVVRMYLHVLDNVRLIESENLAPPIISTFERLSTSYELGDSWESLVYRSWNYHRKPSQAVTPWKNSHLVTDQQDFLRRVWPSLPKRHQQWHSGNDLPPGQASLPHINTVHRGSSLIWTGRSFGQKWAQSKIFEHYIHAQLSSLVPLDCMSFL